MEVSDDVKYGRDALKLGNPWIVPESLDLLETLVQANWDVFEWGAGGSTCYWARKCHSVVSVEHNHEWIGRVAKMLMERNLHAFLLPVGRGPGDEFCNYANAIIKYPDESFDLVSVDGEVSSRGWCLTNAMPKVKVGGILLLDNSDWLTRDLGPDWERQDFVVKDLTWVGQEGTFDWWTSILRKVK